MAQGVMKDNATFGPTHPEVEQRRQAETRDAVLLLLAAVSVLLWGILASWYGLKALVGNPGFSLAALPGKFDSPAARSTLFVFLALFLVYLAGLWLLQAGGTPSNTAKAAILAMALGGGAVNLFIYPLGAHDVFSYVLEAKLAYGYGLNPYVTTPAALEKDAFSAYAFLAPAPLGYGPVWLLLSAVPALLGGLREMGPTVWAFKAFNLALLSLAGWAVWLAHEDKDAGWLGLYLLLANPLTLFDGVGNAHNDAMVAALLAGAWLLHRRDSLLGAPLMTLSALVKFTTAPLVPLLWLSGWARGWPRRKLCLSIGLSLAAVTVTVAPYWAGGSMLAGLWQGLQLYNAHDSASLYSLARSALREASLAEATIQSVHLGLMGLYAVLATTLVLRGGRAAWRQPLSLAVELHMLLLVLVSALYPWYFVPVFAMLALPRRPSEVRWILTVTLTALLSYVLSVWLWLHMPWRSRVQVHLVEFALLGLPLLLFLIPRMARRLRSR
jgi:hypothetical protein